MASVKSTSWFRLLPLGVPVLLALASLACVTQARDVSGFNVRRDYRLSGGEHLEGDQVVMANKITLATGSTLDGSATLTGNRVVLDAEIVGDAVVVADRLDVGSTAHITGDLVVCAKDFNRDPAARIDGDVKKECTQSSRVSISNLMESGWESWRGSAWFQLGTVIVGSLMFGAVAALVTAVAPGAVLRMFESVYRAPLATGSVGCLTMVFALVLTAVYGISLLLILPLVLLPFMLVGWMAVGLLSILGWIALAGPFGVYLLRRLGMDSQPRMVAAALGGIVLSLALRVWSVFWFTAWIGLLATAVLGSIGLGAVILTRIGTRPYPRSTQP